MQNNLIDEDDNALLVAVLMGNLNAVAVVLATLAGFAIGSCL